MEQNKYYIPEIEDIRVGYECELFLPIKDWFKAEEWREFKISKNGYSKVGPYGGDFSELDEVCNLISLDQVRTSYLTKEQIEAEGWKSTEVENIFTYNRYVLYFSKIVRKDGTYSICLSIHDDLDDYYRGISPSINEFRTIMKLLNIK